MTNDEYERTHYEAEMDAKFRNRIHGLHCAIYRRLRYVLNFTSLLAGGGAAALAFHDFPLALRALGLLVAVCSALNLVLDPATKMAAHQALAQRYQRLVKQAPKLKLEELDEALADIAVDDISVIGGLRTPAYNANVIAAGRYDYVRTPTQWERLIAAFAGESSGRRERARTHA